MATYIDRDELMKYPIRLDHYDKEHGNEHFVLGIESVMEYAENLPIADVIPVEHGRWEKRGCSWYCTHCCKGYRITCGAVSANRYKYCPNCGVKMDGGVKNG